MGKQDVRGWVSEIDGKVYALMDYVDQHGKRRQIKRRARNRSEAKAILDKLRNTLKLNPDTKTWKITFAELAEHYRQNYIKPPEYLNGIKIAGYKHQEPVKCWLTNLERFFGECRLQNISYELIASYRSIRAKQKVQFKHGKERTRSASSVNRELALLRKVLNVAVREKWIDRNPFNDGEPLISMAAERVRDRILSPEEEARLLAHCKGKPYLHNFIITALDTGMRPGEIFKMVKGDIDFSLGIIHVWAHNTKTETYRMVPMSERLAEVLQNYTEGIKNADLVFPFRTLKTSFRTACRDAGIHGVTPYCLRHTFGTRLVQAGVEISLTARAMGHTDVKTTYKYTNQDMVSVRIAAAAINGFNSRGKQSPGEA